MTPVAIKSETTVVPIESALTKESPLSSAAFPTVSHASRLRGHHGYYRSMADVIRNAKPTDYSIHCEDRGSNVAILAPHGGKIEVGTTELARLLSQGSYSSYSFIGHTYRMDPHLRVTSTHFDEPQCLELLKKTKLPIVIHGSYDWGRSFDVDLYLGGLAIPSIHELKTELERAGLKVGHHPKLLGKDPRNICNHGQHSAGIQIELHPDLQEIFKAPDTQFKNDIADRVVSAIQRFILSSEEKFTKMR